MKGYGLDETMWNVGPDAGVNHITMSQTLTWVSTILHSVSSLDTGTSIFRCLWSWHRYLHIPVSPALTQVLPYSTVSPASTQVPPYSSVSGLDTGIYHIPQRLLPWHRYLHIPQCLLPWHRYLHIPVSPALTQVLTMILSHSNQINFLTSQLIINCQGSSLYHEIKGHSFLYLHFNIPTATVHIYTYSQHTVPLYLGIFCFILPIPVLIFP
jgi:hypothetical protein